MVWKSGLVLEMKLICGHRGWQAKNETKLKGEIKRMNLGIDVILPVIQTIR